MIICRARPADIGKSRNARLPRVDIDRRVLALRTYIIIIVYIIQMAFDFRARSPVQT